MPVVEKKIFDPKIASFRWAPRHDGLGNPVDDFVDFLMTRNDQMADVRECAAVMGVSIDQVCDWAESDERLWNENLGKRHFISADP